MLQCLVFVLGLLTFAQAAPFGGKGPVETIEEEREEKKTEEQLELEQRLAEIDEVNKAIAARVIVLRWRGTDTDHTNQTLQRNIKNRIARPDARFYPDIDLYQAGRKEIDRTIRHTDQRAIVPDDATDRVMRAVDDVSTIPWNALSDEDWNLRAYELQALADEIWFVDRPELREALFLLYSQIGRAAENSNQPAPPFYESVSGTTVNYYWYLAGAMAHEDPVLMSKLTDQQLNASVAYYKDQLDSGAFDRLSLAFDYEGSEFDPKSFASQFQVFVNGLEVTITNPDGLLDVPLGRVDIYLQRADGHSLSERIDEDKLKDKFWFVLDNARKTMGLDFIDQLMAHPNECTPPVDGNILNYLAIYAKLHARSEVYVAVPKAGSTAPGRIFLWRWERSTGTLVRVQDNTGGFPVRFAVLGGAGLTFGGASLVLPDEEQLEQRIEDNQGEAPEAEDVDALLPIPQPVVDGVPIYWELRGHYNRLMMSVGMQYKVGIGGAFGGGGDFPYADLYQTNHYNTVEQVTEACSTLEGATNPDYQPGCVPDATGATTGTYTRNITKLRERRLQRLIYATIGVMLGKDAAVGFGPRGYLRTGWYNAPHAVDFTAHLGYTAKIPSPGRKDEERSGRVRGLIDADFYGGVMAPYHDSLFISVATQDQFAALGPPLLTFGFQLGAGLTF